MPVGGVAGEPRHLEAQNDPSVAQPDLADQALEAQAIIGGGAGLAQVVINNDHLLRRPAQGDGPIAEGVLASGALRVLVNLLEGRLADVEEGVSRQVLGGDLLLCGIHASAAPAAWWTTLAMASVSSLEFDSGSSSAPIASRGCGAARTWLPHSISQATSPR